MLFVVIILLIILFFVIFQCRQHEHLTKDPRFVPYNALVHYDIDSDVNTIDRVYGTTEQKIRYPKLTDLFTLGVAGVPKEQYLR